MYRLAWLNKVFDPHIKDKVKRSKRLLIINGYSLYVNIIFIDRCDRLKILVLILPLHLIHKLQPLNCGNFLLLSIYYRDKSNKVLVDSKGKSNITKRMFYGLFKPVFKKAFFVANIKSA
jgi:hypothetical protein